MRDPRASFVFKKMAALWKTCHQCLRIANKSIYPSISVINVISQRNYKPHWVAPTLREFKRRKDIEDDRNGGPKIFHRSTFLEWLFIYLFCFKIFAMHSYQCMVYLVIRNYDAEIFAFSNRLGEKFNDATLRTALTHKSYIERETARLFSIGVDTNLQLRDNEDLAEAGGEMISKFTNGYLRAVFTRVPEELIVYVLILFSPLHDYD